MPRSFYRRRRALSSRCRKSSCRVQPGAAGASLCRPSTAKFIVRRGADSVSFVVQRLGSQVTERTAMIRHVQAGGSAGAVRKKVQRSGGGLPRPLSEGRVSRERDARDTCSYARHPLRTSKLENFSGDFSPAELAQVLPERARPLRDAVALIDGLTEVPCKSSTRRCTARAPPDRRRCRARTERSRRPYARAG
jgi:hypothetical protein